MLPLAALQSLLEGARAATTADGQLEYLLAMRAVIDASVAACQEGRAAGCPHLHVQDRSTLVTRLFRCTDCGAEFDQQP